VKTNPISDNGAFLTIGLLDHMGYGNLGDAAIQDVVIANIRKRLPNVSLIGFSFVPEDTTKRHGIPCHPIRWWYPTPENAGRQTVRKERPLSRFKTALKKIPFVYPWAKSVLDFSREALFWVRCYRNVRSLDLLIVSGGGQLGELWRGPWSHPYTIFKFSLLTKLARKKLYLLDVGAGPLKHPLSQLFVRWAVRHADYRSFRDRDSQELIRSIGVNEDMDVYPDPVYAIEVGCLMKNARQGTSKGIVGLNPIGFCDPRVWARHDELVYQAYLEKITRFAVWLLKQGYALRVFTTEASLDRSVIEDLKARLSSELSSPEVIRQVFREPRETVNDVLSEMSEFDFIITSKFHGIIFSHVLSKPVIALSYHRKMDAAMEGVGRSRFCADIEDFDVEWLIEAFHALIESRESLESGFAAAVAANATKLHHQFDSLFLPAKS
jgi:polysaccharide pyruvyl transferase WcaK-like protein